MKSEVSVVLPVWNAESSIERAVRSILQQSLTAFELIVVDDGSTDQTSATLAQISDQRMNVVRTERRGVAAASNLGARRAQTAIIARMDADDIALPERLACQLAYLDRHHVDVVGSRVRIESVSGQLTSGMARYEHWINEETITPGQIHGLRFVEFPLVNPSILAKREYFQAGFAENEFPEDYDLMLRAAQAGMRFGKTPQVLLQWQDSADRLTRTSPRYNEHAFMSCRRHHLLNGPLLDVSTVDLWGAGQTGKPWLRWLQDRKITVRRVIDVNNRKQGNRIHGVPVIAPEEVFTPDGTPLIVAVGAAGARTRIMEFVVDRGYRIGADVWFVA